MADLTVVLHGDAGGATEALHGAGTAAHDAHDKFEELKDKASELSEQFTAGALAAKGFEMATEALKDAIKESWAEAAKAENAHRQLSAAAGELTEAFEKQAEVMGQNFARKSEDIEQMQMLLLRYGAAPDTIGKATEAVLNYAAATGNDANGAMMQLIRGVENGTGSLGRMGVQFKATGDTAEDFGKAADALNAKFGGAAATEADGMTGRMRAASLAVDELKKSFGELMGAMEQKTGVLDITTNYLRGIATGGTSGGLLQGGIAAFNKFTGFKPGAEATPTVNGENPLAGKGVDVSIGDLTLDKTDAQKKKDETELEAHLNAENKWLESNDKFHQQEKEQYDKHEDEMLKKHTDADRAALDEQEKYHSALVAEIQKSLDAEMKGVEDDMKFQTKAMTDIGQVQSDLLKQQNDQQRDILAQRTQLWTSLGTQMGGAIINGIAAAFSPGGGGGSGHPDLAATLSSAILGILGMIPGVGALFTGLVKTGEGAASGASSGDFSGMFGSLGNVGSSGQSWWNSGAAGANGSTMSDKQLAMSGYQPPPGGGGSDESDFASYPSNHSGGWQRFHKGGWPKVSHDEVPSILQTGERVLSRGEVRNMGGSSAVDSAARGGGSSMTVYAMDSQSMLETFGGRGGRSMLNAVRTNKGPLRQMFGGG